MAVIVMVCLLAVVLIANAARTPDEVDHRSIIKMDQSHQTLLADYACNNYSTQLTVHESFDYAAALPPYTADEIVSSPPLSCGIVFYLTTRESYETVKKESVINKMDQLILVYSINDHKVNCDLSFDCVASISANGDKSLGSLLAEPVKSISKGKGCNGYNGWNIDHICYRKNKQCKIKSIHYDTNPLTLTVTLISAAQTQINTEFHLISKRQIVLPKKQPVIGCGLNNLVGMGAKVSVDDGAYSYGVGMCVKVSMSAKVGMCPKVGADDGAASYGVGITYKSKIEYNAFEKQTQYESRNNIMVEGANVNTASVDISRSEQGLTDENVIHNDHIYFTVRRDTSQAYYHVKTDSLNKNENKNNNNNKLGAPSNTTTAQIPFVVCGNNNYEGYGDAMYGCYGSRSGSSYGGGSASGRDGYGSGSGRGGYSGKGNNNKRRIWWIWQRMQ